MPRTKSVPKKAVSVSDAWARGGEIEATRAAVVKYAEVIDVTESGRDMKPLISGMFEAIDRLRALEANAADAKDTPLFTVLRDAAKMKSAVGE